MTVEKARTFQGGAVDPRNADAQQVPRLTSCRNRHLSRRGPAREAQELRAADGKTSTSWTNHHRPALRRREEALRSARLVNQGNTVW